MNGNDRAPGAQFVSPALNKPLRTREQAALSTMRKTLETIRDQCPVEWVRALIIGTLSRSEELLK